MSKAVRLVLMLVVSCTPTVVTGDVAWSWGAAIAFGLVGLNGTYEKQQRRKHEGMRDLRGHRV